MEDRMKEGQGEAEKEETRKSTLTLAYVAFEVKEQVNWAGAPLHWIDWDAVISSPEEKHSVECA